MIGGDDRRRRDDPAAISAGISGAIPARSGGPMAAGPPRLHKTDFLGELYAGRPTRLKRFFGKNKGGGTKKALFLLHFLRGTNKRA